MAEGTRRTSDGMRHSGRREPASEYDPEGLAGPRLENRYEDLRDSMRKGWNGDAPRKR